ncbi:MAG TPA: TrmH family RNA methyltransferase [Flavobacteriaceae bacterium]|nr:TrmH family RNA methyltransferase [Flavobacteriaceae bacterium]
MEQLIHSQVVNNKLIKELVVVSENIRTPENVGMLFRISEAFGVKKVFLVGESPNLENKKVLRTARSTDKNLDIQLFNNSEEVIKKLSQDGFQLVGLELTSKSKYIAISDFSKNKIAIFIGAERFGLSQETLQKLDKSVHINLFGKNSSINVVNALAIALYQITQ